MTFHERPINAHGWTGYGYSIIDPETGAGAYLIEGSGNGGFLDFLVDLIGNNPGAATSVAAILALLSLTSIPLAGVFLLISIVITAVLLYHDIMMVLDGPCSNDAIVALFLGLMAVVAVGGIFAGTVGVIIALAVVSYLLSLFYNGLIDGLQKVSGACP